MLTIKQVAERLNVSYWTARLLVLESKIQGIKVGRQWRVDEVELDRFIRESRQ